MSERVSSLVPFQADRPSRLAVAELRGGEEAARYLVFTVGMHLCISHIQASHKVRETAFVSPLQSCPELALQGPCDAQRCEHGIMIHTGATGVCK